MSYPVNTIVPAAAAIAVAIAGIGAALAAHASGRLMRRQIPALLSAAFFAGSLIPIQTGGAFGFWAEHTRNDWTNQIFLDLLLCAGCAYFLLLDRARAVAMPVLPWFLAIAASGSIGLLAMTARVLFLEQKGRLDAG